MLRLKLPTAFDGLTDPIQLIDLTEVGSGGNLISGSATACDLRK